MGQIQQILRAVNKEKPKLFTLYLDMSLLRILDDFSVYCLVNQNIAFPKKEENLPNVLLVNDFKGLDFDLCFSFSGGLPGRIVEDIAKERSIDCITYEMNYPNELGVDLGYITANKKSFSPSLSFCSTINGKVNLIPPYVTQEFFKSTNILERPLNLCTKGDFLFEKNVETNFDDWHYITNTIPSQIFGFNPAFGTNVPNVPEFASILNSTKIYVNTRTRGIFPIEAIQALCCGCVVISYPYPGIQDFIGEQFVVQSKEQCRELISNLLVAPESLAYWSDWNMGMSKLFKNGNIVTQLIKQTWEDICESGYQCYRV